MLDHVTIGVSDLARSRGFYDAALVVIDVTCLHTAEAGFAGYGAGEQAFFWIGARPGAITGVRVAFAAASRATVDRFHAAALQAGGRDNGGPGPRPQYHPDYYGAFVLDPDGHNIEAVCHHSTRPMNAAIVTAENM